ncbi:hypothetical protein DBR42_01035 [Pelomonas sp. HMWF004]|nr:hypothetical protein DBR42_01035 [Pelomonas sp. HMWF004]
MADDDFYPPPSPSRRTGDLPSLGSLAFDAAAEPALGYESALPWAVDPGPEDGSHAPPAGAA